MGNQSILCHLVQIHAFGEISSHRSTYQYAFIQWNGTEEHKGNPHRQAKLLPPMDWMVATMPPHRLDKVAKDCSEFKTVLLKNYTTLCIATSISVQESLFQTMKIARTGTY